MYYHLQELRYGDYKNALPPAVSLARIDHALFEQQDLNNIQDVLDWITKNWGTIDHFEKYGLGMCIRNQTDIISWCLLDCRLEELGQPISDKELEKMKYERAELKDRVYARIRAGA